MSRNLTPRPIKATGAREAHGRILDPTSGQLYVHMHRERGLSHRHYVLHGWQVRLLNLVLSWPMRILFVVALVTWGWMASQAARVPFLVQEVNTLRLEAERLDTLTATLGALQARYEQVQRLMGAAQAKPESDTKPRNSDVRAAASAAPSAAAKSDAPAGPTLRIDTATKTLTKTPAKPDSTGSRDSVRTAPDTIKPPASGTPR
ncbi:MAG: hypothetical protein IT357_10695 [Gemmatimonadaceae bacterium]|nr:hypothetical protein [Gemmatimonadaceae bacterium]